MTSYMMDIYVNAQKCERRSVNNENKLEQIRKEARKYWAVCMILVSWRNSALRNWERRRINRSFGNGQSASGGKTDYRTAGK